MPKKKILLVDDEPDLVEAVQVRLEANGYEVLTACDGQDGLDKIKEHKPDLIILDILMPKIQGDVVATVLKENESTRDIPVIFLTCLAEGVVQGGGIIAGNFFLAKPFTDNELLSMISKALKNK